MLADQALLNGSGKEALKHAGGAFRALGKGLSEYNNDRGLADQAAIEHVKGLIIGGHEASAPAGSAPAVAPVPKAGAEKSK